MCCVGVFQRSPNSRMVDSSNPTCSTHSKAYQLEKELWKFIMTKILVKPPDSACGREFQVRKIKILKKTVQFNGIDRNNRLHIHVIVKI